MQWENLTSSDFKKAVVDTDVCIIAMGILEKHSEHLPLGTDFLNGHKFACMAAEKEPAVVFPPFYFGQIYEARCFPGTVVLKPALLLEVIQGVFDEIGRNGFKKILVYNAHGGNWDFLKFLNQCSLSQEKPYCIYLYTEELTDKILEIVREPPNHGCEWETSISLANHANLVKTDRIPDEAAVGLKRMKDIPNTYTGIGWYSEYPDHYAGDARNASIEKGIKLRELHVDSLARYIAAVKADEVIPALNKEFFERVGRVGE